MSLYLILLWLTALVLPPAQTDGLTLRARAGYDRLYKDGAAVPVVVSARNDGPPLEGEIRVIGDDLGGEPLVYTAPISLPTQSDKRVTLIVHPPSFGGSFAVQLVSGETVVAETETGSLNVVPRDDLFYGVVSADPGGLSFLETVPGARLDAAVAFLELADLPEVSSAWNGLDVLVLDDVDTSRLTAGQLAALRAWIENGGQLVVAGGAGGPRTAAGVAGLLPVEVAGVSSVEALPALEAVGAAAGGDAPFSSPGPYVVTESALARGELLIHQDGLPLLAHSGLGRGGVFFLALDPKAPPLAGWEGAEAVWGLIAAAAPGRAPWGVDIQDGYAAVQSVSSIPGLRLPSIGSLLLFLFVYTLVIGPVNFLVLRRLKRRELAWVTIPALVLLFSAITYFTSFRTRGGSPMLNAMSIAYGSVEAERLRTQTVIGLYSPQRARYDLSLPYDSVAFPLQEGFGAAPAGGSLEAIARAGGMTLAGVRTDTSEIATFLADAHLPRPAISATAALSAEGDAVAVEVRNDTGATLENAVILYGENQYALGNVNAGETRRASVRLVGVPTAFPTVLPYPLAATPDPLFPTPIPVPINPLVFDPAPILGAVDYFNDPVAYPRWQLIQAIYYAGGTGAVRVPPATEMVTLGGWLDGSAQPLDAGGAAVTRTGATLVLLEVLVEEGGGEESGGAGVQGSGGE